MSLVTFELTEDHIKVLRNLGISIKFYDEVLYLPSHADGDEVGSDLFEDIDLILNGKSEIEGEFGLTPLEKFGAEKFKKLNKLVCELPTALDIILYTGKFEPGRYSTKYHVRDWKKLDNGEAV